MEKNLERSRAALSRSSALSLMVEHVRQVKLRLPAKKIGYRKEFLGEILKEARVKGNAVQLTYKLTMTVRTPPSEGYTLGRGVLYTVSNGGSGGTLQRTSLHPFIPITIAGTVGGPGAAYSDGNACRAAIARCGTTRDLVKSASGTAGNLLETTVIRWRNYAYSFERTNGLSIGRILSVWNFQYLSSFGFLGEIFHIGNRILIHAERPSGIPFEHFHGANAALMV